VGRAHFCGEIDRWLLALFLRIMVNERHTWAYSHNARGHPPKGRHCNRRPVGGSRT
jgi:hypothetical protein